MANLILDININSACNLTNVNLFSKMDVYVVVTLTNNNTQSKQEVKTPVDHCGDSNPKWDHHAFKFSVNERLVHDGCLTLDMKLVSRRRVLGNKSIGVVNVPILELLNSVTPSTNGDGNKNGQELRFATYQVWSRSGKPKGSLMFSYRFNTPMVEPSVPTVINQNSELQAITYSPSLELGGEFGVSSAPPISEIEPYSSPPPEPKIEHPLPVIQHDSDDWKHPLAIRDSSSNSLPVTDQSCSISTSRKRGQANHLAPTPLSHISNGYFPPPQIHNGNGSYVHAPSLSWDWAWARVMRLASGWAYGRRYRFRRGQRI